MWRCCLLIAAAVCREFARIAHNVQLQIPMPTGYVLAWMAVAFVVCSSRDTVPPLWLAILVYGNSWSAVAIGASRCPDDLTWLLCEAALLAVVVVSGSARRNASRVLVSSV